MVNEPLHHLRSLLSQKQVIKSEESPLLKTLKIIKWLKWRNHFCSFYRLATLVNDHQKRSVCGFYHVQASPVMIFRSKIAVLL